MNFRGPDSNDLGHFDVREMFELAQARIDEKHPLYRAVSDLADPASDRGQYAMVLTDLLMPGMSAE